MGGRKEGKEREGEEPGRKRRIAWAKKHTRNPIYFSFLFSWLVCFWQETQCSSSKPDFLLKLRSSSPESPYPLCLFYIRSHARTQTHTYTMHARKVVDWEFNFLFFFSVDDILKLGIVMGFWERNIDIKDPTRKWKNLEIEGKRLLKNEQSLLLLV